MTTKLLVCNFTGVEIGWSELTVIIEENGTEKQSSVDGRPEESRDAAETEAAPERPKTIHKNASKRSLDDAELEGEEVVSLSSSPGKVTAHTVLHIYWLDFTDSKRTRTL